MRAEILGVGTELLLGQIANTNAQWISERLAEIGVDVLHHAVVGDNFDRIVAAIHLGLSRADVLIVTGGLGPTQDDITRPALAAAAGVPLVRVPAIEVRLRERWLASGREMPESNLVQADVPEGGREIPPVRGTAPGLVLELDGGRAYALPGVPAEMREMMEGTVLPELAALAGPSTVVSRSLRCVGMAESKIADLLDDLFHGSANPTVAYLAGGAEVRVRLTAKAATRADAEALIVPVAQAVVDRLGDVVFSSSDESLEQAVGRLLRDAGLTIACAESLTGGELAARLTSVPGASGYFFGAAVAYTSASKHSLLGVSAATLDRHGPVSRACAAEMASGARRLFGSDLAVSLTGAAGPEPHGGADAGEAWVALAAEGVEHERHLRWPGERAFVRRLAEQSALDLVRRHLCGLPLPT